MGLDVVIYIFNKFLNFFFNELEIAPGVYFGWVVLAIGIVIIIAKSVLNLPFGSSINSIRSKRGGEDGQ